MKNFKQKYLARCNKLDTDFKTTPSETSVGIESVEEDKVQETRSSIVGNFKEYTPEQLEDAFGPYQE